jgi:hypothetical protein
MMTSLVVDYPAKDSQDRLQTAQAFSGSGQPRDIRMILADIDTNPHKCV